jgi:NADH:ubiquinone oxidoreductase subunit H
MIDFKELSIIGYLYATDNIKLLTVGQLLLVFILQAVPMLLAIALITLLERRTMSSIQRRRGPNSMGM